MKKIHLFSVALIAIMALGAMSASDAFAASELLVGGNPAVAGAVIEADGEFILTDAKTILGAAAVLCSGIIMAKMTNSTNGTVTEVQDLSENTLSTALGTRGLSCTNIALCEEPLVWPEELNTWTLSIVLSVGVALLDLAGAYDIECMKGLQLSDLCSGLSEFLIENLKNGMEDFDFDLEKTTTEDEEELSHGTAGSCALGGANSGTVLTQGLVSVDSLQGTTAVD